MYRITHYMPTAVFVLYVSLWLDLFAYLTMQEKVYDGTQMLEKLTLFEKITLFEQITLFVYLNVLYSKKIEKVLYSKK